MSNRTDVCGEQCLTHRHAMSQCGFTMAELLVGVSLAMVLAAIAVPHLPGLYRAYQLSSAARQLATDLMRVRMKAIGEMTPHRIVFSTTTYQVQVNSGDTFVNDGVPMGLPAGASFSSPPATVTFSPIGLLANAATMTVTTGEQSKTITINELGKVAIR